MQSKVSKKMKCKEYLVLLQTGITMSENNEGIVTMRLFK